MSTTITGNLGISDEWVNTIDLMIKESINASQTVSETVVLLCEKIKKEEFGEGEFGELSIFEKKLMLSGFFLHIVISDFRANNPDSKLMIELFQKLINGNK